jgi:hypothetical protein
MSLTAPVGARLRWLPGASQDRATVFSRVRHMREYRIYSLNDVGSLDLADTIIAADDRAAIIEARNLKRHARKCKVWEGRRLVMAFGAMT